MNYQEYFELWKFWQPLAQGTLTLAALLIFFWDYRKHNELRKEFHEIDVSTDPNRLRTIALEYRQLTEWTFGFNLRRMALWVTSLAAILSLAGFIFHFDAVQQFLTTGES